MEASTPVVRDGGSGPFTPLTIAAVLYVGKCSEQACVDGIQLTVVAKCSCPASALQSLHISLH